MPIKRKLTREELDILEQQGIDSSIYADKELEVFGPEESADIPISQRETEPGVVESIYDSLRAKVGGTAVGGASSLAAMKAATRLGSKYIPHKGLRAASTIGSGVLAALAGGGVGQSIQNRLQGEELTKKLKEEEALAHEAHPYITGTTDLAASALASGGSLSPTTAYRGTAGIISKMMGKKLTSEAAQDALNVGIQSTVMPALYSGIEYARSGQIPSAKDLLISSVGGAFFAKPSKLGEWAGREKGKKQESGTDIVDEASLEAIKRAEIEKSKSNIWNELDEKYSYVLTDKIVNERYKQLADKLYKKPDIEKYPNPETNEEYLRALAEYEKNVKISTEAKRARLADLFEKAKETKTADTTAEPTIKIPEGAVKPDPTKVVKGGEPVAESKLPKVETEEAKKLREENEKFIAESNKKLELQNQKEALENKVEELTPAKGEQFPIPSQRTRRAGVLWDNSEKGLRSLLVGSKSEYLDLPWEKLPNEIKEVIMGKVDEIHPIYSPDKPAEIPKESSFIDYVLPKEFYSKLRIEDTTEIPSNTLYNWLKNTINENSKNWKLLESVGLKEFLHSKPKVTPKEVHDFLNSKIKVDIRTGSDSSGVGKEYQKMTHEWFDTLDNNTKKYVNDYEEGINTGDKAQADYALETLKSLPKSNKDFFQKLKRWLELSAIANSQTPVEGHVNWADYNPKPVEQMEGYVEIAVVKPSKRDASGKTTEELRNLPEVQFPSSHSFPPNTLSFVRGFRQGDTFFITEVQSDWAQSRRNNSADRQKLLEREGMGHTLGEAYPGWPRNSQTMLALEKAGFTKDTIITKENVGKIADYFDAKSSDPLLAHCERLALKAAIEHAKKTGAKRIAIQTAESAMMTEGHDAAASMIRGASIKEIFNHYDINNLSDDFGPDWKSGKYVRIKRVDSDMVSFLRVDKPEVNNHMRNGPAIAREAVRYADSTTSGKYISQEGGMRLHYDRILPSILKELTGQEGKIESFGEHKMAHEQGGRLGIDNDTILNADRQAGFREYPNEQRLLRPRKNLIFKNADGTPMTHVEARVFDISNLSETSQRKLSGILADPNAPKTAELSKTFEGELLGRDPSKPNTDAASYKQILKGIEEFTSKVQAVPKYSGEWTTLVKNLNLLKQAKLELETKYGGRQPSSSRIPTGKRTQFEEIFKTPRTYVDPIAEDFVEASKHHKMGNLSVYIKTQAGNVGGALDIISRGNSVYNKLAKAMLEVIDDKSAMLPIRFMKGLRSEYAYDKIGLGTEDNDIARSFMHEVVHGSLVKKMPIEWYSLKGKELKQAYDDYLIRGEDENIKQLLRCYYKAINEFGATELLESGGKVDLLGKPDSVRNYTGVYEGYYLGNIDEFTAGLLSDRNFARMLNAMTFSPASSKSIWTKALEAVQQILGIYKLKHGTVLQQAVESSFELIKSKKYDTSWNAFNAELTDAWNKKHGWTKTETQIPSITSTPKDIVRDPSVPESFEKQGFSFFPALTSRFDKVAELFNNPVGIMVRDALRRFNGEFEMRRAKYGNTFIPKVEASGLSKDQLTKVQRYNHEVSLFGESKIKLSPEETAFSNVVKEHMREIGLDIQENGPKILTGGDTLRLMKLKDEGYFPSVLGRNVAYEWAEHAGSNLSRNYDIKFIEHLQRNGVEIFEARQILQDYKTALGRNVDPDVKFQAIRRAEGYGLPWELVDQNITSAVTRYSDRAARDVAFYMHLQKDPKIRKALDLSDEQGHRLPAHALAEIPIIRGASVVESAMRSVIGIDIPRNPTLNAAFRAAGNTVMGPGTAARNLTNLPAFISTYLDGKRIRYLFKGAANINTSKARALASGAVKPNFSEAFDAAGYVLDDPNPMINYLNKYSSFMRKWSGRDLSDKLEAEYLYSIGELLATDHIANAQLGKAASVKFVKRFGDLIKGGPNSLIAGRSVTPDDVMRLAKRFVDANRGTYSAEGLPSWAIEGELAPFAALAKFSLEKSNTVYRDVVAPLKKGNYMPLIKYTAASLGVGALIEKLNEELSNKRGPDPTVSEAIANGSPEVLFAKFVGLLQLASYAGIISDGAKAALQMQQGKELRYNQPLSMPLYTMITETLMGNTKDAIEAIREGGDPFDILAKYVVSVAGQSVQAARYINAYANEKETKRKEKFRDVNVFHQMEGRGSSYIKTNPYKDLEAKKFKRTEDVGEAMKMLPGLIQKALKKSKGNPYELQKRLKSLKQNSYQIMPNLRERPDQFEEYINLLKRTQGDEAAAERLQDYIMQNLVNQAKASAIP